MKLICTNPSCLQEIPNTGLKFCVNCGTKIERITQNQPVEDRSKTKAEIVSVFDRIGSFMSNFRSSIRNQLAKVDIYKYSKIIILSGALFLCLYGLSKINWNFTNPIQNTVNSSSQSSSSSIVISKSSTESTVEKSENQIKTENLEKAIADKDNKIKELEAEVENQKQNKTGNDTNSVKVNQDNVNKIAALNKDLANSVSLSESLKKNLSDQGGIGKENVELKNAIAEYIKQLNESYKSVADLTNKGSEKDRTIGDQNNEIKNLKNQLAISQNNIVDLTKQVDQKNSQISTLNQNYSNIQTQLNNLQNNPQQCIKEYSVSSNGARTLISSTCR